MVLDEPTDKLSSLTELQRLRDLGRYYLHNDMVAQALRTYTQILELDPNDVATLVIIGDSYLMAGDGQAAAIVYQKAREIDDQRKDIVQRLDLASKNPSSGISIAGGFPPLHPQAVNRLAEKITGKSLAIDEEQVRRAAELMEKTIHSESPASSVSEHLDEIDALLPAILELNIRQARTQGRPDLANELIELQRSLLAAQPVSPDIDRIKISNRVASLPEKKVLKVVLVGEASTYSPLRMSVIKAALQKAGMAVEQNREELPISWEGADLVVAHNPHYNPDYMKALAGWAGSGNPLLVDMDMDFREMGMNMANKSILPAQTGMDTRSFVAALQLADVITFPSTKLALQFSHEGYQAYTVPDGWTEKNSLWRKKSAPSSRMNIGLFSEPGNLEAVASIRRVVIRILREFPQSRLVVCGDPAVYQLFESIPDTRRIYIPPSEPEDYPYLLAQADIHLFPRLDDETSKLEGDRRYMEIGVRQSTWIGSPTGGAEEWNTGGLIARSPEDWYTHMKTLVQDIDCRTRLAEEGYEKAAEREAEKLAVIWEAVIQKVFKTGQPKPFLRGEK